MTVTRRRIGTIRGMNSHMTEMSSTINLIRRGETTLKSETISKSMNGAILGLSKMTMSLMVTKSLIDWTNLKATAKDLSDSNVQGSAKDTSSNLVIAIMMLLGALRSLISLKDNQIRDLSEVRGVVVEVVMEIVMFVTIITHTTTTIITSSRVKCSITKDVVAVEVEAEVVIGITTSPMRGKILTARGLITIEIVMIVISSSPSSRTTQDLWVEEEGTTVITSILILIAICCSRLIIMMVVLITSSNSIVICVQLNSCKELINALKSLTPHVMEVVISKPEVAEAVEEVDVVVVIKTNVRVITSTKDTITKSLQESCTIPRQMMI